jgi:hypothetical protein
MKKFIVFAVVLALLVPSLALAATEFSLGGFIKLDAFWDSTQGGKNMNGVPARSNDGSFHHGRMKFTAQGSRFNFTIKGPKLWGADISGYLEMDFDTSEVGAAAGGFTLPNSAATATAGGLVTGVGSTASQSYTPRLRHAMIRFNWPTSELLFGQYVSMFCEWYAESAEDGPMQMTGTPTARLAQIRFTQKFLSDWTVAGLVGEPQQALLGAPSIFSTTAFGGNNFYGAASNNGEAAESPQVQAKVTYAHDWWGKAAYYGKPTPFTAQVVAGWQRNVMRQQNNVTLSTLANDTYGAGGGVVVPPVIGANGAAYGAGAVNLQNEVLNPWMVMGTLFIPVIPTQSANLAGTASILTQWWMGQGVEAFGIAGVSSNLYRLDNNRFQYGAEGKQFNYEAYLLKKFGGMAQAQYYFNNQWFVNAVYGVSKAYGVSRARSSVFAGQSGANNMEWGFFTADNAQTIQQVNATLWYRPIQAIKFGLQYSYVAATYFQYLNPAGNPASAAGFAANATKTINRSHFGDEHRVEFVGFFFF